MQKAVNAANYSHPELKLILGVCTLISAIDAILLLGPSDKIGVVRFTFQQKAKVFFPKVVSVNEISHYAMNRAITFTGKEFE